MKDSGARIEQRGPGEYALCGELSFATVPDLLERAQSMPPPGDGAPVTVDLSDVSRSDSAGLALLVEWTRAAREHGAELRFRNVPRQMRAMAEVSGLDGVLPLDPAAPPA